MAVQATGASRPRAAITVMWGGLALTIVATVYPLVDLGTTHVLADHVRATYPAYDSGEVDAAVTAYLAILSVVGVLGVLGWLGTMWAVRGRRAWAPWAASGVWLAAACLALTGLTVKDTSGEVGLAPPLAWLQVLPCVPGLVAVVLLWRRSR
ncbi:hypothetical protein SAMN05443665_104127 [Actinomadura meyerae]|uniref:Uncharacterized protein n=1 Tax=Actinomadura meyerae TaxID=240840 RepID=A0A239NHW5_9ACTN|nr:hypothetical protein [Actinomadura meyerae]SNT54043.1 hypothetical protein SAMN05443665_104127 [Actinomadura meyerae]